MSTRPNLLYLEIVPHLDWLADVPAPLVSYCSSVLVVFFKWLLHLRYNRPQLLRPVLIIYIKFTKQNPTFLQKTTKNTFTVCISCKIWRSVPFSYDSMTNGYLGAGNTWETSISYLFYGGGVWDG